MKSLRTPATKTILLEPNYDAIRGRFLGEAVNLIGFITEVERQLHPESVPSSDVHSILISIVIAMQSVNTIESFTQVRDQLEKAVYGYCDQRNINLNKDGE